MRFRKKSWTGLALVVVSVWWAVTCRGFAQEVAPEVMAYAVWVLYNGKILTADESFHISEALAVRDGKFLAVGETDRILKMAGPQTRRIDLKGKSVTPGFIETHSHSWIGNAATSGPREDEWQAARQNHCEPTQADSGETFPRIYREFLWRHKP